jgi:hypothetical protein
VAGTGIASDNAHASAGGVAMTRIEKAWTRRAADWVTASGRDLSRVRTALRARWRRAPRALRVVVATTSICGGATVMGVTVWAGATAARLDLDAVQRTPLVFAAGRVTHLLRGVVDRGTGAAARGLGLNGAVAGKTGTTNDTRDAWFVGYSPRLVAVVWVGFDDGASLGLSGAQGALPIWTDSVPS